MGLRFNYKNRLPELINRTALLDGMAVDVGFFEDDRYGPENNNLPVATVAAMNEFGTSLNPSRPFMEDTFRDKANKLNISAAMRTVMKVTILGNGSLTRVLKILGSLASEAMRFEIQAYASEGGNSKATIERKGRDSPLIDTGKMLESVKFVITRT